MDTGPLLSSGAAYYSTSDRLHAPASRAYKLVLRYYQHDVSGVVTVTLKDWTTGTVIKSFGNLTFATTPSLAWTDKSLNFTGTAAYPDAYVELVYKSGSPVRFDAAWVLIN